MIPPLWTLVNFILEILKLCCDLISLWVTLDAGDEPIFSQDLDLSYFLEQADVLLGSQNRTVLSQEFFQSPEHSVGGQVAVPRNRMVQLKNHIKFSSHSRQHSQMRIVLVLSCTRI